MKKKKTALKLALMGLAIGSAICGCHSGDDRSPDSGKNGDKAQPSCTGKSGCNGKTNKNGNQSDASLEMKAKRESVANELSKK